MRNNLFKLGLSLLVVGTIAVLYLKSNQGALNLVLISVDTLRPDHMGVYGYEKNTTPHIDTWAKQATVFTNARTVVPFTYPSISSMMTARSPFNTKIFSNISTKKANTFYSEPLGPTTETLASLLQKEGYATGAIITNDVLQKKFTSLDIGFDTFKYNSSENSRQSKYKDLLKDSLDWLNKNKNNRFFLWVHLLDPHYPYDPPEKYKCEFVNKKYCNFETTHKEISHMWGCQEKLNRNGDEPEIMNQKGLYDGEIRQADSLFGQIQSKLKQLKLDKNTVVVLYGDHGEGFDHNYYFAHGRMLYDSSLKTPLIIKHPLFSGGGKKIDSLIENTDILPTLLNLLRISDQQEFYDGKSFTNDVFSNLFTNFIRKRKQYVYSVSYDLKKYSISDGQYKYIYSVDGACLLNSQRDELYDLRQDQNELNNIVNNEKQISTLLKRELLKYLSKYNLPQYDGNRSSGEVIDQQTFNKLKGLGY